MKNIYLIVGPSGVGKTTLVEKLAKENGLKPVESYTTREPRYEGETSHIFVSDQEFDSLGEMVAYTEYNGHRYGVTADIINSHDLYVIDPFGIRYMQERYFGPKGVKVIELMASAAERESRMRKRGDKPSAIRARIKTDETAFGSRETFSKDFQIHADGIEETAQAVWEFIQYHERYDAALRIYQINPNLDKDRVMFCGTPLLKKLQGNSEIINLNLSIYDEVWAGGMPFSDLDAVFLCFNGPDRPNAATQRSMSVSDIVEISNHENEDLNGMWFCDSIGWKKITNGTIRV